MLRFCVIFMLAISLGSVTVAADEAPLLRFNPFEKPVFEEREAVIDNPVEAAAEAPPRLTATLVSEDSPMVILEGDLLGLGQEREGYILKAVRERIAVFEYEGKRVEIEVAGPETGGTVRR